MKIQLRRDKYDFIAIMIITYTLFILASCEPIGADESQPAEVLQTLLLEARGEGLRGMQAVGEVIRTRAKEKRLGWKEVVMQPLQFSCWNESVAKMERRMERFTEADWQLAGQAWAMSENSNITCNANHYLAKQYLKYKPSWAKEWLVVAVIGKHTFYRL